MTETSLVPRSCIVGMLLHNALLNAGHEEWHTVHTHYDLYKDDILVRFDRGPAEKRECVDFRVPARLFDPVEYARAEWPEWFVKRWPVQLDLFPKQE